MTDSTEKALNSIKFVRRPLTPRGFRRRIFVSGPLTYAETIKAFRELKENGDVIKLKKSFTKYRLKRIYHANSFRQYLYSLSYSEDLPDNLKQLLKAEGISGQARYDSLKELLLSLSDEALIKSFRLTPSLSALRAGTCLKLLPSFHYASAAKSIYQKIAAVKKELIFGQNLNTDTQNCLCLLCNLIYLNENGQAFPIAFKNIDGIYYDETLLQYELRCVSAGDYYYLNGAFLSEARKSLTADNFKKFLTLLKIEVGESGGPFGNIRVKTADVPVRNLVLILKIFFAKAIRTRAFESRFADLSSVLSEGEEKSGERIINCAVLLKTDLSDGANSNIFELGKIYAAPDEELDKTALSCFSDYETEKDTEVGSKLQSGVIGDDFGNLKTEDGCERAALYSMLCNTDVSILVNKGTDTREIITKYIENAYFQYAKTLIFAPGIKYEPKAAATWEKNGADLTWADFETVLKNRNLSSARGFLAAQREMIRALSNAALIKLEDRFDALPPEKTDELKQLSQKLLTGFDSRFNAENLSGLDLIKYRLYLKGQRNKFLKEIKYKEPKTAAELKEQIKNVRLLNKYLTVLFGISLIRGSEKTLAGKIALNLNQYCQDFYQNKLRPIIARNQTGILSPAADGIKDKTEGVYLLSSAAQLSDIPFIPGLIDKSAVVLRNDADLSLADFILLLYKSKNIIIIRPAGAEPGSDTEIPSLHELIALLETDSENGLTQNDLTHESLFKNTAENSGLKPDSSRAEILAALLLNHNLGARAVRHNGFEYVEVSVPGSQRRFIIGKDFEQFKDEKTLGADLVFTLEQLQQNWVKLIELNQCAFEFDPDGYIQELTRLFKD